jgi:hypothetical protein
MTPPVPHTWHTDEADLRAYADGASPPVTGASVEAHLMVCADCRDKFAPLMPAAPLEEVWSTIRERVEAPRPGAVEKVLGWLGMSPDSARLLAAVPAFGGAWLLGLLVVTVFACTAAVFSETFGLAMFLLIAPLVPVAGVAAAFGGDADPCHELVTVTPHSALRLLLLRTVGVLVTSTPAVVLVGLALPGSAWLGVSWLAPAAAGATLCLALAPLFGSTTAAAAIGASWSVAVVSTTRLHEPLAVVEPAMQLIFFAIAVVAVIHLLRSHSFDQLGRQP